MYIAARTSAMEFINLICEKGKHYGHSSAYLLGEVLHNNAT